MQLFDTDLSKALWAHDVEMTSMRRYYVASTSLRRHVPAGNLAPLAPQYSKPCPPPNIRNLPTPMCCGGVASSEKAPDYLTTVYMNLSYDVSVFHWTTPCHKNHMTTRVITLWRVCVTSLTTTVSTMRFYIELVFILKAINS